MLPPCHTPLRQGGGHKGAGSLQYLRHRRLLLFCGVGGELPRHAWPVVWLPSLPTCRLCTTAPRLRGWGSQTAPLACVLCHAVPGCALLLGRLLASTRQGCMRHSLKCISSAHPFAEAHSGLVSQPHNWTHPFICPSAGVLASLQVGRAAALAVPGSSLGGSDGCLGSRSRSRGGSPGRPSGSSSSRGGGRCSSSYGRFGWRSSCRRSSSGCCCRQCGSHGRRGGRGSRRHEQRRSRLHLLCCSRPCGGCYHLQDHLSNRGAARVSLLLMPFSAAGAGAVHRLRARTAIPHAVHHHKSHCAPSTYYLFACCMPTLPSLPTPAPSTGWAMAQAC